MQGWIEGFQESIDFIEQNLTEELDTADIAAGYAVGYRREDKCQTWQPPLVAVCVRTADFLS